MPVGLIPRKSVQPGYRTNLPRLTTPRHILERAMPDLVLPRNWGHAGTRKTWLRRRDGDNCHLCGLAMTFARAGRSPDDATIDHIVPKSQGGGDAATNLRLAHKRCNEARGNLSMEDWVATSPSPASAPA